MSQGLRLGSRDRENKGYRQKDIVFIPVLSTLLTTFFIIADSSTTSDTVRMAAADIAKLQSLVTKRDTAFNIPYIFG